MLSINAKEDRENADWILDNSSYVIADQAPFPVDEGCYIGHVNITKEDEGTVYECVVLDENRNVVDSFCIGYVELAYMK